MGTALSVAIMGHPDRAHFIARLAEQLPEAEVVLDERGDRWDTGRRSLLAFDPAARHHLVVQDDAVLCRDLLVGAAAAAQAAGERPVGLYLGSLRPYQQTVIPALRAAKRAGSPWLEMQGPWWGVAIILPTAHIPEIVRWGDANSSVANYDRRIAAWYDRAEIPCWYTVPSLVDHRGVEENPSLIPERTGNRRAHWFIGAECSALEIDWHRDPVGVGPMINYRHRSGRICAVRKDSLLDRRLGKASMWEVAR